MSDIGRLYQLYEFRNIGGVKSASPGSSQNGKFLKWNNSNEVFDYSLVGSGDIDESYLTTFVTNVVSSLDTDTYLESITKVGNYGQFLMSNGTPLYLQLGELAWLDEVPVLKSGVVLPGNSKVLFDDNGEFGGEDYFTFDKTSNKLQFKGTSLVFDLTNGTEGTYKEALKYLGNYSWRFGGGVTSSTGGSYNTLVGYRTGAQLASGSTQNTIIGTEAGYLAGSLLTGSVFVGAFSGKYETASDKFFLDNTDYSDTTTARASSFMYADLNSERRLYVRDSIAAEKEIYIGPSGLTDGEGTTLLNTIGAGGLIQFISDGAGGVKPQYHDYLTGWQDFANGVDTYLSNVAYATGALTFTMSDASTIGPIDISAVNTTTFATSPSSPATGQTANSDYGYIQISNSAFTNNEGFTYATGFVWNNSTKELYVPGAVNLATLASDISLSNGSTWSDGDHAYIKLNGTSIQIDNETPTLDNIDGTNIGGATYEVFKQRTDDDLEFRTFQEMPIDASDNPYDRITMAYSSTGNAIFIGTSAEKNRLDTQPDAAFDDVVIDRDNDGETLLLRALRPGTGVTLTQNEEYILIDATGAGGGEVNTMNNNGTGLEFYAAKNGAQFEMFTLDSTDGRVSLTQATDYTTDPENLIDLQLEIEGANLAISSTPSPAGNYGALYSSTTDGAGVNPTLNFRQLICTDGSVTINQSGDEIILSSGSTAATGTNLGAGIAVYSSGTAPDFEFKTITATGDHVIISANGDGNHIDIDVEHIQLSDLGSGEYILGQVDTTTNSFVFGQKAISGDNGIDLSSSTATDIIVDQTIPIPYFAETVSGTLDSSNTGSDSSTIIYNFTFDADVRDANYTGAITKFFELNIGDGLSYDSGTNTISANVSGGGGDTNYNLKHVEIADNTVSWDLKFYIDNDLGTDGSYVDAVGDSISGLDTVVIPKYSLPIADNTDVTGATGDLGGVKIYSPDNVFSTSTQNWLVLDETTGRLTIPYSLVTYDSQYNLHDADTASREQARANIAAAFINGDLTEDFNADNSNVAGALTADSTTDTHQLGNTFVNDNLIKGADGGTLKLQSTELTSGTGSALGSFIHLQSGDVVVELGDVPAVGNVYFKDRNGTTIMKLSQYGDLYVLGNIYANADIEAFSGKTL